MAVGGFPIIATARGPRNANDPWFLLKDENVSFTGYSGNTLVRVNLNETEPGLLVNDDVVIVSNDVNKTYNAIVNVNGFTDDELDTNAVFVDVQNGTVFYLTFPEAILWDSDTPENFLRIIHVQFDITPNTTSKIEVTFDDGVTWMPVLNNEDFQGVGTFTFFVTKTTQLNFRATGDLDDMGIIVSSPR